MNPDTIHNVYMVGIGGMGMSALARYFKQKGAVVSGYDREQSALCHRLEEEGVAVHYTPSPEAIPDKIDLAVYTPAVPNDHAELEALRERKVPLLKRSEALEEVTLQGLTLAVAGTHGKTTITALLAHLLKQGNQSPTAFLGGLTLPQKTNFIAGSDELFVAEADEYDRSFLRLRPYIGVVTAIDPDHLDVYKNKKTLREAFKQFAGRVTKGGTLLVHNRLRRLLEQAVPGHASVADYALQDVSDYYATNIMVSTQDEQPVYLFDLNTPEGKLGALTAPMPGMYNVENTVAAVAVAHRMQVAESDIREGLKGFQGIWRRFEYRANDPGLVFIDDYAHHPREIEAVLQTVRNLYPNKPITVVFQPHLYSRTRDLAAPFAEALSRADTVILLDIYPAREKPIKGVSSETIYRQITSAKKHKCTKAGLPGLLKKLGPRLLLTLGAGDIDREVESLLKLLRNGKNRKKDGEIGLQNVFL